LITHFFINTYILKKCFENARLHFPFLMNVMVNSFFTHKLNSLIWLTRCSRNKKVTRVIYMLLIVPFYFFLRKISFSICYIALCCLYLLWCRLIIMIFWDCVLLLLLRLYDVFTILSIFILILLYKIRSDIFCIYCFCFINYVFILFFYINIPSVKGLILPC